MPPMFEIQNRRRTWLAHAAGAALLCALGAAPARGADAVAAEHAEAFASRWGLIETYCVECHNFSDWAGEIAFDVMTPEDAAADADVWEKAIRKLKGGLMPPPGEARPERAEVEGFVGSLEAVLDAAAERPNPGFVGLHRLNRTEYANAVRDLLGVEIDATELLPRDNMAAGYDNIAEVLSVSPTFMEQYVSAARSVALTAVGDADSRPSAATYVNENGGARRHVAGLPLGTRGGLVARHYFPADGEYVVNIADMAQALWVYDMEYVNTVVVTLDGVPVYETEIGGDQDQKAIDQYGVGAADQINQRLKNIAFEATAGPHDVGVAFLARTFAEAERRLQGAVPGGGVETILRIASFEIRGPFNPTGVSDSAPRARIFTCAPEDEAARRDCAAEIIAGIARRAYRRPLTDSDLQPLMAFYDQAAADGGHDEGVRQALTAILASPDFLYRYAAPPEDAAPGETYALNDIELASRLSFFLWSSIPDDELLDEAEAGRLSDPDVLEAQVRRMLADERSRALVESFAFQWLDVAKMDEVVPDTGIFPHAAGAGDPRDAYRQELALFIESIFREDRPVHDLLTADHTYVNEQVARLYGIEDVRGDQFRRITLTDPARFGLLGKGAVLVGSSYPNRTAPVLRGKFILENFLGAPPSPPPPGVDTDLTESDPNAAPLTIRERMAQHRTDPSCNSCHGVMDPLGLALENFTAVGEWRRTDLFTGQVIDSSGELPDGTVLAGPEDLREALVRDPEQLARTFTEELLTFALGRMLTAQDMPTVRAIARDAAQEDYRVSSLVLGVVESPAFRMMTAPGGEPEPVQEAALAPGASLAEETSDVHSQ